MSTKVGNISSVINHIGGLDKESDLSKYGKDFQMKLIALLIKDRGFSFSIIPIIKNEYFSDIYLRKIFFVVSQYIEKYQQLPTYDNIRIILEEKGEKMITYDKVLKDVISTSIEDRDFVIDNARKFCFIRFAITQQEEVKRLLIAGEFEKAKSISTDSFKYSGISTAKMYSLKKDFEKVFNEEKEHNPIPLPFPTFNDNMKGGPGAGNLVIMVAESNFGKTNCLIALARHANKVGKTTVLFSFEIGGGDMLRRHLAGLGQMKQEEVKNSRAKIERLLSDDGLGDFILIEERATNARISTMKNWLDYLKSMGIFPGAIYVDALNQLKLPVGMRVDSDNNKFEYLCEELRDWCNDEQLPLFTVMQSNRGGFNSEIVDVQSIGKAIEPFQVADVLFTFAQTRPMAAENKCTCLLLKNRLGKKFIALECYYDPNMCVFEELGVINDMMLLSDTSRNNIKKAANNVRERLHKGEFDKKN